jgi:hypothetical protein
MQSAEDELAIRSLAAAYSDAVNRRDHEGMAPVQGIEKITKRYRRLQSERDFLCQMIHSGIVEVTGDRATARWWFSELKKPVGSEDWLYMIGVYQDDAVRLDIGWRFAKRSQTTILDQSLPGDAPAMNPLPFFLPLRGLPTR